MVFTTACLFRTIRFVKPTKSYNRFWKRRKILRMAAHFYGRSQNCYSLAVRAVHRALTYATNSGKLKREENQKLYQTRIAAACEEHGFNFKLFKRSLTYSDILLSNRILADLAIWEPRTFKCLTDFAWNKAKSMGLKGINDFKDPPSGVVLRQMKKID